MLSVSCAPSAPLVESDSSDHVRARARSGTPTCQIRPLILVKLVKTYKNNKCLWDSNNKDYRNKRVKAEAWETLLLILREQFPNANRDKIKKLIFTMRQNYTRNRKKVLNAKKPFEPRLWYYGLLNFLSPHIRFKVPSKDNDDARPGPSNNKKAKNKRDINDLIQNLPDDQKPMAHKFITEIMHRGMLLQMPMLKLSIGVNGHEYVLIPRSEPDDGMLTLEPSTSRHTPELPMIQQDLLNGEYSEFLEFAAVNPNYTFSSDIDEIIMEDDRNVDDLSVVYSNLFSSTTSQ